MFGVDLDGSDATLGGAALLEAVAIAALVVRRRRSERGRRLRVMVTYRGPDTEETLEQEQTGHPTSNRRLRPLEQTQPTVAPELGANRVTPPE